MKNVIPALLSNIISVIAKIKSPGPILDPEADNETSNEINPGISSNIHSMQSFIYDDNNVIQFVQSLKGKSYPDYQNLKF